MNLATLLPPIVAATVLNIIVFALAWKGGQIERERGETPWQLTVGMIAYGLPLLVFLYTSRSRPLTHGLDLFGVALAAEAMGGLIVTCLVQGIGSARAQPWRERLPMVAVGSFLLLIAVGAMLKTG